MYIEGFGEEEFVKLDGTEFEASEEEGEPAVRIGPDPLEKALAGTIRRRAKKLD